MKMVKGFNYQRELTSHYIKAKYTYDLCDTHYDNVPFECSSVFGTCSKMCTSTNILLLIYWFCLLKCRSKEWARKWRIIHTVIWNDSNPFSIWKMVFCEPLQIIVKDIILSAAHANNNRSKHKTHIVVVCIEQ